MRSHKVIAYTATCLAVLGGLALAKPSVVHAANPTGGAAQTETQQSALNYYQGQAYSAYDLSTKQTSAQNAYDAAKAAADQAHEAYLKNPTGAGLEDAWHTANQTASDKLDALNAAKKAASDKQTEVDQYRDAKKKQYGVTDAKIKADSEALNAANAKVESDKAAVKTADDAHKAAITNMMDSSKNYASTLKTYEEKYEAWRNAGYKNFGNEWEDLHTAGEALNGVMKKGFTFSDYNAPYKAYLDAKDQLQKDQKDVDKKQAQLNQDAGFDIISNLYAAKKQQDAATAALAKARSAFATDPSDANVAALQKATNDSTAADKAAKATQDVMDAYTAGKVAPVTTTTPTQPTQPTQPTEPSEPSDNNQSNTNNSNNGQTIYVSYAEHPSWKVALLNDAGQYTQNYVDQNASYTIQGTKTVNGETVYKIGENQWIPAKYTSATANANAEEAVSGIGHLNPVSGHPTWKIQMMDASGKYTGVFLKPNTDWKVFGRKTINGRVCYRLGSQSQWVPAEYLSLN